MHSNFPKGVLLCLIATAIWGTMFPVMTGALAQIYPFTFTALRYTLTAAALLLNNFYQRRVLQRCLR